MGDAGCPVLSGRAPKYEFSSRIVATTAGGVGAIHTMVQQLGFGARIDDRLHLFKRHLPYHESDHVLAIAYNFLAGGRSLQDLDDRREDEAFLDMLGARRLPDPTTAGDFLRRFSATDIQTVMDVTNETRVELWRNQSRAFRRLALVDIDGTVAETTGSKKAGMARNKPKASWGYAPLLISLANTAEPLLIVNRPGNAPSQKGATEHIDHAIDLVDRVFDKVLLRGDTAFSLTANFDRWNARGIRFVFGYDAHPNLVKLADGLDQRAWSRLDRAPRYESPIARQKREDARLKYVEEMGWTNLVLESEHLAEISYKPSKCKQEYRLVILRKTIRVEKGQPRLFGDETRYFFYICNDPDLTQRDIVHHSNQRCDQENLIEQLKNGVPALKAPVHDLVSNWAYMVVASLAWTLKAWFGLVMWRSQDRELLRTMKFRRFLTQLMLVPCQVLETGRRLVVRVLARTQHVRLLFGRRRVPCTAT